MDRFCVNCKYFMGDIGFDDRARYAKCERTKWIEPVMGNSVYIDCAIERHPLGPTDKSDFCGPEGKYFESPKK